MVTMFIASGVLGGIGVVCMAQGTVTGPTQKRWLLSGAFLLFLAVGVAATAIGY